VVVASSSNFFIKVLKNIKHSHPLVYLKGIKIADMEALLSFMYQGQANVAEENLKSFLALAEELEVKGLTCCKNSSVVNHQPPVNATNDSRNGPSHPDLQNHAAQRLSSASAVPVLPTRPTKLEQTGVLLKTFAFLVISPDQMKF